jgi:N-acetylglucosamine malate deacetylase 1
MTSVANDPTDPASVERSLTGYTDQNCAPLSFSLSGVRRSRTPERENERKDDVAALAYQSWFPPTRGRWGSFRLSDLSQMDDQPLDVIAVGAHPDDVEIACGGTLARLVRQGYRVGIVDLTDGEPTPASPGPEVRLAEARAAAEVLGAKLRVTLDLPNRRLFDTFEARVALAKVLRRHRPRLVIGLGERTPLASPDHWQARQITEAGVFYSKLSKWDEHFDGLPLHVVPGLLYCYLSFRSLQPTHEASTFVVDISDELETKMAAIACYKTQFPPAKAEHLFRFRAYAEQQGMAAGFRAGEVLASPVAVGVRDLMGFTFATEPPR